MGLIPCSTNRVQIFNNLEKVMNKLLLSSINSKIKKAKSIEEQNNYKFISSLIIYYHSLKDVEKIKKKYSYYIISSKTKNISAFCPLKNAQELFVYWIKLFFKNKRSEHFILDNREYDDERIQNEIMKNIKQNKLYDIFIENFNSYYDNINNKSFTKLILLGPPDFLRPIIWKIILEKKDKRKNRPCMEDFLNQKNNNNNDLKQIYKDINRTFIINETDEAATIDQIDDEKINKLKNVLIAISNYNSEIGYTQGMNNLIGFLLKVTKFDEKKAFDLAVLIMDKIKGYFTKDFPSLKANLIKFNNEFIRRNNKLYNHFKEHEIPDELWISKWLQTLFTINFKFNEICRLWDSLIVYGFDFIIYLSLSIIYFAEDSLLKFDDSSDIINELNEMMNSNRGIKKFFEFDPDYKDYVIPIYNIISRAKKIRTEILLEVAYFNSFNNNTRFLNFYDSDLKEYQLNKMKKVNFLNSGELSNYSSDVNRKYTSFKHSKSTSRTSDITFLSNNNYSPLNNNYHHEKSETSINKKELLCNKQDEKSENSININNNIKFNKIRKNSDFSISSSNSKININNIITFNKANNNNIIKTDTNSNTNLNYLNNNVYCYSGINNLKIIDNNNINFVNGRPRRNTKIMVHRKMAPLDNVQGEKIRHNYISKSPDFYRIKYNTNNNQIHTKNMNMNYNMVVTGYIQNYNYVNNNNFNFDPRKRGSYNISLPIKFNYGYY